MLKDIIRFQDTFHEESYSRIYSREVYSHSLNITTKANNMIRLLIQRSLLQQPAILLIRFLYSRAERAERGIYTPDRFSG